MLPNRVTAVLPATLIMVGGLRSLARAAAPYSDSPVVTDISFNWSTHERHADGSDNWAVTWADDDNQYGAWGDGYGWAETGAKQSLGVTSISGTSSSPSGTDLWGLPVVGSPGGKSYGILSVDGVLYMWVGPGSGTTSYDEARIYRSTTHGTSWTQASWAFTKNQDLIMPTFLNFGQDYAGARDDYVYAYFIRLQGNPSSLGVMIPGQIDLARVPKTQIMIQGAWEFFAGMSGPDPTWTSDPASRQPVFEDTNGVGWNCSVSYNAGLGRYLLCTEHTDTMEGRLGMFDAPEPWGPWMTVYYAETDGRFGDGHVDTTTFYWNCSNKWLSGGGRDFILIFSGTGTNDAFNMVAGHFILDQRVTLILTETNASWGAIDIQPEPNDANNMLFARGSEVTLTPLPIEGKALGRWEIFDPDYPGDVNHATIDANGTTTVIMDTDMHVNAVWKCGGGSAPFLLVTLLVLGRLQQRVTQGRGRFWRA